MSQKLFTTNWWGRFEITNSFRGQWSIGPSQLTLSRQDSHWQLSYKQESLTPNESVALMLPINPKAVPAPKVFDFQFQSIDANEIHLQPCLADRGIVARPQAPFFVLANQELTLHITTPLWVKVSLNEKNNLKEFAAYRLSDTWFGSSPQHGELCYANMQYLSRDHKLYPANNFQAITEIIIRNNSNTPFLLERLNLPVMHLGLYANANNQFWTQSVVFERDEDDESAHMRISDETPAHAQAIHLISEPREKVERSRVVKVFNALFK